IVAPATGCPDGPRMTSSFLEPCPDARDPSSSAIVAVLSALSQRRLHRHNRFFAFASLPVCALFVIVIITCTFPRTGPVSATRSVMALQLAYLPFTVETA